MENILNDISTVTEISTAQIKSGSRRMEVVASKALFSNICHERGIQDRVIADFIGVTRTSVIHYRRSKKSDFYKYYESRYRDLLQKREGRNGKVYCCGGTCCQRQATIYSEGNCLYSKKDKRV